MSPLDEIMEALELEVTEEMDDAAKVAAIIEAITLLQGGEEEEVDELEPPEVSASHRLKGKGLQLSSDSIMVSTVANSRNKVLDALVLSEDLDPALRDDLEERFCNRETLALSMSTNVDDGFDFTVEALQKNAPLKRRGRQPREAGAEDLRLEHGRNNTSPLTADAKKRVEARNARR